MSALKALGVSATVALAALALAGCASGSPDPVGTWGTEGEGEPHLVLAEGGELSGSDGCNRLMGSWEADGKRIDFGEVASTMMACEGVDTWLADLASGEIDGDSLTVLDAAGDEIGTLKRG